MCMRAIAVAEGTTASTCVALMNMAQQLKQRQVPEPLHYTHLCHAYMQHTCENICIYMCGTDEYGMTTETKASPRTMTLHPYLHTMYMLVQPHLYVWH